MIEPAGAGDARLGQQLYVDNCVDCHGETGEGDDRTPDIRGAPRAALARALPGFDEMPEFDFTDAEVESLRAYLDALDI